MVYNKVEPLSESSNGFEQAFNDASSNNNLAAGGRENSVVSSKEFDDLNSISTIHLEESEFLKLKPFSRIDPTLMRLLRFLQFYGLFPNTDLNDSPTQSGGSGRPRNYVRYLRVILTLAVAILTSEVVYDVNLRQSKLLAEQKRSTPLLTFVIVAYSWLTLVIPLICDISLIMIGPYLFRFYSRTTSTVCNGEFH